MSSEMHAAIVDILSSSHDQSLTIESRLEGLSKAAELILGGGPDLIDEFCETFLSLHIDTEPAIRRFAAYFVDALCSTMSVYSCRCLSTLSRLLQDSDPQVIALSLKASRTVYKRALYWIAVQQKEDRLSNIAKENVKKLEVLLGRTIEHLQQSSGLAFRLSCKTAESVILSQSISGLHPRSQTYLETSGCSSLEDLRISERGHLDNERLKVQANKLLEYLCSMLVEYRVTKPATPDCQVLCRVLANVAYDREEYIPAVLLSFQALADELTADDDAKLSLQAELKRILSSRNAIKLHPMISTLLSRVTSRPNIALDLAVFRAEIQRIQSRLRMAVGSSESDLYQTDKNDLIELVDDENAVAVCYIRAQNPGELAKLAVSLLSRLPSDVGNSRAKVCRSAVGVQSPQACSSKSFQGVSTLLGDAQVSMTGHEVATKSPVGSKKRRRTALKDVNSVDLIMEYTSLRKPDGQLHGYGPSYGHLLSALSAHRVSEILQNSDDPSEVIAFTSETLSRGDFSGVALIVLAAYSSSISGLYSVLVKNVFSKIPRDPDSVRNARLCIINLLPQVTPEVIHYLEDVANGADQSGRRLALAALAHLFLAKPSCRIDSFLAIARLCFSCDSSARADAVKIFTTRVYVPLNATNPVNQLQQLRGPCVEYCAFSAVINVRGLISTSYAITEYMVAINSGITWVTLDPLSRPHLLATLCRQNFALLAKFLSSIQEFEAIKKVEIFKNFAKVYMNAISDATLSELLEFLQSSPDPRFVDALLLYLDQADRSDLTNTFIEASANYLLSSGASPDSGVLSIMAYVQNNTAREVLFRTIAQSSDVVQAEKAVTGFVACCGGDVHFLSLAVSDLLRIGREPSRLPAVMAAANKLLTMKGSFECEKVFRVVMQNVSEDGELPPAFLRFVIQVIQGSPGSGMEAFVATEVLPKLSREVIVQDPTHWRGLSMIMTLLVMSNDSLARHKACEAICGLPHTKIQELVARKAELKVILRDFLVQQPVALYTEVRRVLLD